MATLTTANIVEPMTNALSAAITSNTASRIPGFKNLTLSGTKFEKTVQVSEFFENLEDAFNTYSISDANKKKNSLVHHVGPDLWTKVKQMPESSDTTLDAYEKTKLRIQDTFCMSNPKSTARGSFDQFTSNRNESFIDGYIRLKRIAMLCDFGDSEEERILEKLRITFVHDPISIRIKHKTKDEKSLRKVLQIAREILSEKEENDLLRKENPPQLVNQVSQTPYFNNCKFCSRSHRKGQCPAYGAKCNNCSRFNHFSKCCPSRNNASNRHHTSNNHNYRGRNQFHKRGSHHYNSNSNNNHNNNHHHQSGTRGSPSHHHRGRGGRRGRGSGRRGNNNNYSSNHRHGGINEVTEAEQEENSAPEGDTFEPLHLINSINLG